jgi:hypothetical protein
LGRETVFVALLPMRLYIRKVQSTYTSYMFMKFYMKVGTAISYR